VYSRSYCGCQPGGGAGKVEGRGARWGVPSFPVALDRDQEFAGSGGFVVDRLVEGQTADGEVIAADKRVTLRLQSGVVGTEVADGQRVLDMQLARADVIVETIGDVGALLDLAT